MPRTAKPDQGLLAKYLSPSGSAPAIPAPNAADGRQSYFANPTSRRLPVAVPGRIVPCPPVNPGAIGSTAEPANALSRPGWQVIAAYRAAQKSLAQAKAKFPRNELHNGPGDAWRHFRWNYSMARTMGAPAAQAFANAHEVSSPNEAAELAMDLHNNAVGRAFGSDPKFARLTPDEAAYLALRSGCLTNWARPTGR